MEAVGCFAFLKHSRTTYSIDDNCAYNSQRPWRDSFYFTADKSQSVHVAVEKAIWHYRKESP
jgi:hypothetical protein